MNSKQTAEHRVERTPAGKFAVVKPEGEVLHEFFDQAAALMAAAAADGEPVRSVSVMGRWDAQKETKETKMAA